MSIFGPYEQISLIYPETNDTLNQVTNILLIDNSVPSYQTFVDSVNSTTFPIVYSIMSSKTELLKLLQEKFTCIPRIGICFTSSLENTQMFLDWKQLFLDDETEPYSENLLFIINIINEFGIKNIDFLACNTLNYPNWVNYYELLTKNTGVIVGASNDKTGNVQFGGDWVLESTSKDIELIYFTKSIEYYQYLFDNPSWATSTQGIDYPGYLAVSGNYLYVPNFVINTISKISLTSQNTDFIPSWATNTQGLSNPWGLTISENYLYVANRGTNTISKISLTNPSTDYTLNWATNTQGLSNPISLSTSGNYLYVTNIVNNTISKISLTNPTNDFTPSWATNTQGLSGPWGLTIEGNYLYVANRNTSTISKISLTNPNIYTLNWATNTQGLNNPIGLTTVNGYLYAANPFINTISQISLTNPSTDYTLNWATSAKGLNIPVGLIGVNGYLYVSNNVNSTISEISLPPSFTITSNYVSVTAGTYISNYYSINSTGSAITSYSISPAVGNGLNFNTSTGLLSGVFNNVSTTPYRSTYIITGSNSDGSSTATFSLEIFPQMVCFLEDSKILTKQGYIPIQDLRKGDLIKTIKHGYVPIDMIGYREIYNPICQERIKDKLYVCSNKEYSEIFEDLVITGCHSILVENYTSQEQLDKSTEVNGGIFETDGKWRLPACVDERARPYEKEGLHTIYHLALENEDYFMNYGIYANGLVVETCSKRYLKELSNMTIHF